MNQQKDESTKIMLVNCNLNQLILKSLGCYSTEIDSEIWVNWNSIKCSASERSISQSIVSQCNWDSNQLKLSQLEIGIIWDWDGELQSFGNFYNWQFQSNGINWNFLNQKQLEP